MSEPLPIVLLRRVGALQDERLRAVHKLALWTLAAFMPADASRARVTVSIGDLSAAMCGHRNTVRRALRELETWGFVRITAQRIGAAHLANVYEVTL